jgi:decaprenylphospho-beta-D-ribofuranose 2-oxidase
VNTLSTKISGWGRFPEQICNLSRPEKYSSLQAVPANSIPRGLGRSYGDAALNEKGSVLLMERLNRFLQFDSENGIIRSEAGVSMADILKIAVPRGWFPAVTPGTKHVTLGGCAAADVHGKNHHRDGSFGDRMKSLELITASGERIKCSASERPEIFWATIGGMGLTGIVGEVETSLHRIETAYIAVRHYPASNLEAVFHSLSDDAVDDYYSVAWLDVMAKGAHLGRGITMCGHHATMNELPVGLRQSPLSVTLAPKKNIPVDLPCWVLNNPGMRLFNTVYFNRLSSKQETIIVDYDRFFYPLDRLDHWNRLYGKRGFMQYQCVLPGNKAIEGVRELLEYMHKKDCPSYLAVLKRFGAAGKGMLSFPIQGFTLALDIPIYSTTLLPILDAMDQIVLRHDGRVYLAKDARMSDTAFQQMYSSLPAWQKIKKEIDPENRFSSSLSRRLRMTEAL